MTLLDALKQRQLEERLSDEAFAERLGVSRQLWFTTRTGKVKLGKKIVSGAVKAYPDLVRAVVVLWQAANSQN